MAECHDILVVDDRSLDAQETLIALEQVAPAASALHMESGAEALQYLFSVGSFAGRSPGLPRLVLLSVEMSGMSGLCVLDMMRAHPLTRGIRVVVLSLEPDVRKHRHHDAFDADAYITRPCAFQRYCAVLSGCVRHWLPSTHRCSDWHDASAVPRIQLTAPGFSCS
jgi:two-component system, response regulator